jgi:DinB superfamily
MSASQSTLTRVGRPDPSEYAPFYAAYVARVPEEEPLVALEGQTRETAALLRRIPEPATGHRYAEGKWSVRDVIGHLADTERVMSYRALRFARGDAAALAGFDERTYADAAGADRRAWQTLVEDLATVRAATLALFRSLDTEAWQRRGTANGATVSVRALAHIIVGHERHHLHILKSHYGLPAN